MAPLKTSLALLSALALPALAAQAASAAGPIYPHNAASRLLPSASVPSGSRFERAVRRDTTYTFTTLNDAADPTFNQLLGINNNGVISGYFGSGAAGHPNQGYTLDAPYSQSNYINENFPGSLQTQVVAINDSGDTAGFWADADGNNFGFIEWNGVFTSYRNPHTGGGTVNQLLGINDRGIAVGFYTDATGVAHGYQLNQATGRYSAVVPPSCANVFATGINNRGDVVGYCTGGNGAVIGFIRAGHTYSEFAYPNQGSTTPFGINDKAEIVGAYVDTYGATHGFTLKSPLTNAHWTSLDDPNGIGTTFVNGVNDMGDLVGFYTDAAGNTDGFLATP